MNATDDIATRLTQLGLDEDEAQAYLALLRLGLAKASDVASAADLSRPKTYRALDELRARGLASATTGRPRQYQAAEPATLFEHFRSRRRLEMEEIQHAEEDLSERLDALAGSEGAEPPEPRFDVLRKRPAVLGYLRRLVDEADDTLELIVSHPAGLRVLGLEGAWQAIVAAVQRGVRLRLIVSPQETQEADRELLDELGADIELRRIADLPPTLFAVADGQRVLVSLKEDPSRRPKAESSVAFATDADAFVHLQRRAFGTCWENGSDPAPHLERRTPPSPAT